MDYRLINTCKDCKDEDIDRIKILLDRGIDINIKDNKGYSALSYAIINQQTDIMKILIENGISVNQTNSTGQTPIQLILRNFPENRYNIINMIDILIKNGVDINTEDGNADTPLMYMVKDRSRDIVYIHGIYLIIIDYLVKNGADVTREHDHGYTPLEIAINCCSVDTVEILLNHIKINDVHFGLEHIINNIPMIDLLVKHGFNIDKQDKNGNTLLIVACLKYKIDTLKYLIQSGANLNIKDKNNNTAFKYRHGDPGQFHKNMIKLLVNAGCDIDDNDRKDKYIKYLLHKKELLKLREKVKSQQEIIDQLNLHIKYMPGGPGMLEAEEDFMKIVELQTKN